MSVGTCVIEPRIVNCPILQTHQFSISQLTTTAAQYIQSFAIDFCYLSLPLSPVPSLYIMQFITNIHFFFVSIRNLILFNALTFGMEAREMERREIQHRLTWPSLNIFLHKLRKNIEYRTSFPVQFDISLFYSLHTFDHRSERDCIMYRYTALI